MKIVFILNLSCEPNSIKRINEFQARGYDVEAYGFDRHLGVNNKPDDVDVRIVGDFSNSLPYLKRLPIIYKGIREVLQNTSHQECLYYLRGLEVALCFLILSRKQYIYEEADMVHVNFNNHLLKRFMEMMDKMVIKKSLLSVFLSEGFLKYHYGNQNPANVHVIPNKLNPLIVNCPYVSSQKLDVQRIKIGFVGIIRYRSIYNFARIFCQNFPQGEFHFYGVFSTGEDEKTFLSLKNYKNCFFHGKYTNPQDLPQIYSQIDMVLSTYDVDKENVRYAEPNKIYEAIYFETPIIVSSKTYLAEKVERMGIGYAINAMNDDDVVRFISQLTERDLQRKIDNTRKIDKRDVINVNDSFFNKLESLI